MHQNPVFELLLVNMCASEQSDQLLQQSLLPSLCNLLSSPIFLVYCFTLNCYLGFGFLLVIVISEKIETYSDAFFNSKLVTTHNPLTGSNDKSQ